MIGVVYRWDHVRGFGFVLARDTEFFLHVSDLTDARALTIGDFVEFDARPSLRGPRAVRVRRCTETKCLKCGRELQSLQCSECRWTLGT